MYVLFAGNLIGAVCFHELGNLEQQTGDNITAENVSLDDGWTLNGNLSKFTQTKIKTMLINMLFFLKDRKTLYSIQPIVIYCLCWRK